MDYGNMTSRAVEMLQKIQTLPDIFYRYTLNDREIVVDPIKKNTHETKYSKRQVTIFEYELPDVKGKMRTFALADPDTVEFGIFDGRRKCVFFKESDKKRDAALIFDKVYEDQIAKYEDKIRKAILKRRDLARCINCSGGETDGKSV